MLYRLTVIIYIAFALNTAQAAKQVIFNASYDIARELFAAYNPLFAKFWLETTGNEITIKQSHAGSSKQANAILYGMKADVVTFNQVTDIQILYEKGKMIPENWASRLPDNSAPYYSTIAFLVRKGNPKNIHGWEDLVRKDVSIVLPNPKTSGNGRYSYLAALAYAKETFQEENQQYSYLKKLLSHVAVFDIGGRSATTSFVERGLGDVLLTFESEVNNIKKEYADKEFEIIVPNISILAEFPVTWIDKNVDKNRTKDIAKAYLNYLYSEPAQKLLISFNYRVHNPNLMQINQKKFPKVSLKTVEEIAGSWSQVMKNEFASGARLDQLQRN